LFKEKAKEVSLYFVAVLFFFFFFFLTEEKQKYRRRSGNEKNQTTKKGFLLSGSLRFVRLLLGGLLGRLGLARGRLLGRGLGEGGGGLGRLARGVRGQVGGQHHADGGLGGGGGDGLLASGAGDAGGGRRDAVQHVKDERVHDGDGLAGERLAVRLLVDALDGAAEGAAGLVARELDAALGDLLLLLGLRLLGALLALLGRGGSGALRHFCCGEV